MTKRFNNPMRVPTGRKKNNPKQNVTKQMDHITFFTKQADSLMYKFIAANNSIITRVTLDIDRMENGDKAELSVDFNENQQPAKVEEGFNRLETKIPIKEGTVVRINVPYNTLYNVFMSIILERS